LAVDTPLPEHFELLRIGLKQGGVAASSRITRTSAAFGAVIVGWEEERLNPL